MPDLKEKAHPLHPRVQQGAENREVEVLRSDTQNYSPINRYSPLVDTITGFDVTGGASPAGCFALEVTQVIRPTLNVALSAR